MSAGQGEQPRGPRLLQMGPVPSLWALMILLGVVLMVGGGIVGSSTGYLINPTGGFPQCDRVLYRNLAVTGSVLGQGGILLLVLGFFGAASLVPNLDRGLRAALIISGVVILVFPLAILRFPFTGSFYC